MKRLSLILAALLAPWASAGASEREEALIYSWTEMLRSSSTLTYTRSHAKFLEARKIPLEIAPREDMDPGNMAEFRAGRVLVNGGFLDLAWGPLREEGLDDLDSAVALAMMTLPSIVHELSHAMLEEDLLRATGRRIGIACVESEYLAFVDQARAAAELAAKDPRTGRRVKRIFGDADGLILDAWARSPGALEERVRFLYSPPRGHAVSILRGRREDILALIDSMKLPPPGPDRERIGRRIQEDRDLFQDPKKLEEVRSFLRARYAAVEKDWSGKVWRTWRKGRKPGYPK